MQGASYEVVNCEDKVQVSCARHWIISDA